ncbi:MAG: RNA polymerase sigma factor [Acidimicrobiales bacterium]
MFLLLVRIGLPDGKVSVNGNGEGILVEFVRVEYPALVAALGLVCGSREAAEDAVQEALAKAVIAEQHGRHIDSLPAWVRVVALNVLRNRWRSLAREQGAWRRLRQTPARGRLTPEGAGKMCSISGARSRGSPDVNGKPWHCITGWD